jgi:glycine betaine/proline transport system substrate-binding protein
MIAILRSTMLALLLLAGSGWAGLAQDNPSTPDVTTLPKPSPAPAAGGTSGDTAAPAELSPPCGTQPLAIARMIWPSAQLLSAIHQRILTTQFGCDVRVIEGDMAATGSSMATTSQPAVAPEMWIDRIPEIWNPAIKAQKLRPAGPSFGDGALEGWFIPDYVAQAHPEITNLASLKAAAQVFANAGGKPQFVSCPIDWGCAVINRNLLRANGLDQLFTVVEPANRFELDTLIAEAVGRKQPILFYYWQPNAVLSQFSFKALDMGPYNKDNMACLAKRTCASPQPSAFAPEPVLIALADWVFSDAPTVAGYFQRAAMPLKEMNALLAELNAPGATVDAVADKFVATRQEVWQRWVGAAQAN